MAIGKSDWVRANDHGQTMKSLMESARSAGMTISVSLITQVRAAKKQRAALAAATRPLFSASVPTATQDVSIPATAAPVAAKRAAKAAAAPVARRQLTERDAENALSSAIMQRGAPYVRELLDRLEARLTAAGVDG